LRPPRGLGRRDGTLLLSAKAGNRGRTEYAQEARQGRPSARTGEKRSEGRRAGPNCQRDQCIARANELRRSIQAGSVGITEQRTPLPSVAHLPGGQAGKSVSSAVNGEIREQRPPSQS